MYDGALMEVEPMPPTRLKGKLVCNHCGQPCGLDVRDDSVGYTYMGSHGQMDPSRPYAVSDCCESGFSTPPSKW